MPTPRPARGDVGGVAGRILVVLAVAILLFADPAFGASPPSDLTVTCDDPHLLYWTPATGATSYNVYQEIRAFADQPFERRQIAQVTTTAMFTEPPEAKTARYVVRSVENGVESGDSVVRVCPTDLRFAAGAETADDPFTWGYYEEWSRVSADYDGDDRWARVNQPKLKGAHSWSCTVLEGDDAQGQYGERCEYVQMNTDEEDINPQHVYREGDVLWVALAFRIPGDGSFIWCGTQCSEDYDGGAVDQIKQGGSCGTPALAMPTYNYPAGHQFAGLKLEQKNSDTGGCESNTMEEMWRVPIATDTWIKVLRHIRFKNDSTGWLETWVDTDGDAINDFEPVPICCEGLSQRTVETVTSELGEVERVYTHTQKSPTDHPSPACADTSIDCSQQRIGVYRGGATANITGDSTIYHDSVAAGSTAAGVIKAAF